MQCRGHRGNGESFLAEVWFFQLQREGTTPKLAAIIADVSEDQNVAAGLSFDQKERPSAQHPHVSRTCSGSSFKVWQKQKR